MKKRSAIVLCIILLFGVSGCASYMEEEVNNAPSPTLVEEKSELQQKAEDYLAGVEEIKYVPDGKDHAFFIENSMTSSEKGIYFLEGAGQTSRTLWYYDVLSGQAKPFCNRPECAHEQGCSSYLALEEYYDEALFYDNGRIYLIAFEEDGGYLVSWAEDATDYQKVGRLWEKNAVIAQHEGYMQRKSLVHEGYLYFLLSEDFSNYKIYRYPLNGGNAEELADFAKQEVRAIQLHCFEEIFYLSIGSAVGTEVFLLDFTNKTMDLIWEDEFSGSQLYVENGLLYGYNNAKGLYSVNMQTGEQTVLFQSPYAKKSSLKFRCDGSYFYLENSTDYMAQKAEMPYTADFPENIQKRIYILEKNGTLIDEIILDDNFNGLGVFFGDPRYLVVVRSIDSESISMTSSIMAGTTYVTLYDKRLIGSGINHWTAIAPWSLFE